MSNPLSLLILTDGKKGHENQSLGLAEAMLRRRSGRYQVLTQSDAPPTEEQPTAIITAGHRNHLRLLRLAKRYRCPSIVIMKPSLPSFLFSHCLIPAHDLRGKAVARNVTVTVGSLNRIPETIPPKQPKGLIMLGGPSKHFSWAEDQLIEALTLLLAKRTDLQWTVGNSRRTPDSTWKKLQTIAGKATLVPHEKTAPEWLPEELLTSTEAWITPDSSSMIYEGLSAGCRVGTLPLPPLKSRLAIAQDTLVADNWVTAFDAATAGQPLPPPPATLRETARCAEVLLAKLTSASSRKSSP